ncbi:MAG: NACHT domain-containing NTPase [Drouetiella hepatica Uher 2000/2452]|uniref:NACHT domain-containing NTPase n=1 Tax=Drouetiella hepatica Uher 2000/2452 TaxID=904376 RepID=A0A951QAX8_9CYAN|nr:NACHT domain-containing NTPase [Drouetiella hepatica Uher 2000/2452]
MAKRSLQASPAGIQQVKKAFDRKGWTQEALSEEVNLKTRQPIWRFFTGRPIERHTFIELCSVLDVDWREIAENSPVDFLDRLDRTVNQEVNTLVQQVRSQRQEKIQDQCGTLQLLDVNRPIALDNLYIDVNILEEIASQNWVNIENLQDIGSEEFDRYGLGESTQEQILGVTAVETYSRVRVLGKPGSGKTTFLQYLALQCNQGEWESDRVPVFITLRDFEAEFEELQTFSLLNYICQEFLVSGVDNFSVAETLLHHGKILLLLDGMDEVSNQNNSTILKEIRKFSEKYHRNIFVATCRTANEKFRLNRFTDVEIAPFTQEQITSFAQKWFVAFANTSAKNGLLQSTEFIQKLNLPENAQFRRLTVTPLFLHLACWVFHRQNKFPTKRAEFYKQCLDILLTKWDETRGIERDEIYQGLLLPQKLKLMSQVAAATFEQGAYFFEKRTVEQYIGGFIQDLPNAPTDPEELQLDSEGVLKAIEVQHGLLTERFRGIFSFSYLAFQEYFTARKIVASHNLQTLEQSLERLVSHITEPRWREVFLLTVAMLRSADSLVQLMKQHIDALVTQDPYLQEFLTWASQKSRAAPVPPAAKRAFYLALARTPHLAPHFALAVTLDQGILLDAALDDLVVSCALNLSSDFAHAHACADALRNALVIVLDSGLHQSLQQLKDQFPNATQDAESFQNWWQNNHLVWTAQLREAIAGHQDLKHHWEFSPQQQLALQRYYDANQLLIDCLNSNCEVTAAVRQEIESALLLPRKELEEREWE